MTKSRATFLKLLSSLEDSYKVTFKAVDNLLFEIVTSSDRATKFLKLNYAAKDVAWAEALPYGRIEEIHQILFAQVVVNTFISVGRLTESYLRILCRQALRGPEPFDETWFSFNDLATLAGMTHQDLFEVNHYPKVAELMSFIEDTYSSSLDAPTRTVTHNDVLSMFTCLRGFAEDFEAAYMIANPRVKETEI